MNKEEIEAIKRCEKFSINVLVEHPDICGSRWLVQEDIKSIKAVKTLLRLYRQLEQENNQLKEEKTTFEVAFNLAKRKEEEYEFILKELRSWLEDEIHNIVPEGCGINYNCEYDSEEDYVRAMEERSRLNTLKDTLSKLNELEGKND